MKIILKVTTKLFFAGALLNFAVSLKVMANEVASPETYFNKISKSLAGQAPSPSEWAAFVEAKKTGTLETFFSSAIDRYLSGSNFAMKLKFKTDELLRVTPQARYFESGSIKLADYPGSSSYDYLVNDLIAGNQPWSNLLTKKSYKVNVSNPNLEGTKAELKFFTYLKDDFSEDWRVEDNWADTDSTPHPASLVEFKYEATDPRLAGILSTPRFLTRYSNTALNKSRRRAAAVFRIFLCDSMMPAIPARAPGDNSSDFDVMLPDSHKTVSEESLKIALKTSDLHGSAPDCRACHYKLDPLGANFRLSPGNFLNFELSPGALTYQRKNGAMTNFETSGLSELAEKIVQQPEYLQCQVEHFWNWFVGRDSPRSLQRTEELVKKFVELEQKPKDFVRYLVQQPEFRQKPKVLSEDQMLARQVIKILKNCTSCHEDQNDNFDVKYWDMTEMPWSKSQQENAVRVSAITKQLDLEHNGLHRKMPPKESLWQISPDDIGLIQKWVQKGAPDFEGVPQVLPGSIRSPPHMEREYR